MKKIVTGFLMIASSAFANDQKKFGYLLTEPFVNVSLTYVRNQPHREDTITPDVFFSDSEWKANIEYPTKYEPLVISKIKATPLEGFNKKNYAAAEYDVTKKDLQKLKNGSALFVIEGLPQAKKLNIRLEEKEEVPQIEKKDIASKSTDGG